MLQGVLRRSERDDSISLFTEPKSQICGDLLVVFADTPLLRATRVEVTAMTTSTSPMRPWVVNVLDPFNTQQPSDFTPVVRIAAASLPDVASVSPHAPIFSPRASGTR